MTKIEKLVETILSDKANLIGEGPWIKDSCYRVYKFEDKFFAVLVCGQMNLEIMEDCIIQIPEENISKYITIKS